MAARHLETGRALRHRADEVFFTASTLKIPLLVELYRRVDRGIVDPRRRALPPQIPHRAPRGDHP